MKKINKNRLANTLALHHLNKSKVNGKGWFEFAEKWFLQSGHPPDKISGKVGKTITFKRGKASLVKEEYAKLKNSGLWIGALVPEKELNSDMFDYKLCVHLHKSEVLERGSDCLFSWDDVIISWENSYINALCKDLWHLLKPTYGYAFQRLFDLGPSLYPSGMIVGLEHSIPNEHEERKEITRWGIVGVGKHSVYRPYMIRDIYPLNYLSPQHLQANIGGKNLEQWILSDPVHGTLEEIAPDFYCWAVEPENIETLRQELKPYKILIAFLEI